MKRTSARFLGAIFAGLIGCLAFGAQAAVQVTRFDPPVQISAFTDPSGDSSVNVFAADLDANGVADFSLGYGLGAIGAYFNAPVRFGQRVVQQNVEGRFGPLAAVPLDSTIGTNIISSIATNFYAWSSGYTNRDDLTQSLGNHETTVTIANVVALGMPQGTLIIVTNGWNGTNFVFTYHPVISGDIAFKDAVMALEFYIDGQRHYGYIHFNFNNGAAGVIYGWAYETEPNTPILAASLALPPAPPTNTLQLHSGILGMVDQGNLPGWTVLIWTANGTFVESAQPDNDGYFKVDLKPGRYELRPFHGIETEPVLTTPNNSVLGEAKSVTIRRNHFTFVTLPASSKASDSSKR